MIRVLLSTYNGERYLAAQLDSVLAQDTADVTVLVRDDGSTDGTREILARYAARFPSVRVVLGENVGVVRSFFALLREPIDDAVAVAFCDQDDVWLPDKLSRALRWLGDADQATMYCSRVRIVDAELNARAESAAVRAPAFANALVENIATGCTVVLNGPARALVLRTLPPTFDRVLVHDWWIYQVMTGLGRVLVDPESRILYRQHGSNAVGAASGLQQLRVRLRRFVRGESGTMMRGQAEELRDQCGALLRENDRRTLTRFLAPRADLVSRVQYALTADVWRQARADSLALRLLVLAGRV